MWLMTLAEAVSAWRSHPVIQPMLRSYSGHGRRRIEVCVRSRSRVITEK
jgi:uncharacterized phage-associated protein